MDRNDLREKARAATRKEMADVGASTNAEAPSEKAPAADAKRKRARPSPSKNGKPKDARPEVLLSHEEHAINDDVVKALAADPDLFQRGGSLVRIVIDRASGSDSDMAASLPPRIDPLSQHTLRELMTKNVAFKRQTVSNAGELKKDDAHPPVWSVNAVLARGRWDGIRRLECVIEYPALRTDSTILLERGYDERTGLVLMPAGKPPVVPDAPSLEEARAAAELLLEVVRDFPFERDIHKSAFLAALLTPLTRFSYSGPAPLFLVDANVRGAGKGLLLDLVSLILTGKTLAITTYPTEEEELRKRITSMALHGERLVSFDNVSGRFGNASLEAALTATVWKDRSLGSNRMVEVPLYITWFATGNNVDPSGDLARRICHIRLESGEERPEDRHNFRHADIREHVRRQRRKLQSAALTILRGYAAAGRPIEELKGWGSFEGWSAAVRAPLVWLGLSDPAETRVRLQQHADRSAVSLRGFLHAIKRLDPHGQGKTASEWVELAKERENGDLCDSIVSLAGKLEGKSLGYHLRRHRRRVVDGLFLDHAGDTAAGIRWVARPTAEFFYGETSPLSPPSPQPTNGDGGDGGDVSSPKEFGSPAEEASGDTL